MIVSPAASLLSFVRAGLGLRSCSSSALLLDLPGGLLVEAALILGVLTRVYGTLSVDSAELGVLLVLQFGTAATATVDGAFELPQIRLIGHDLLGLAVFAPLHMGALVIQLPRAAATGEPDFAVEGLAGEDFATLRLVGGGSLFSHLQLGWRFLLGGRLGVGQVSDGQTDGDQHQKQSVRHGFSPQIVANTKHQPTWS